ncbi:ABC transporter permease [Rhizobium sp. CCGE 510]|uniref:ABC transporter permease n=1 Tax=Rhizobium sp. CCGE 510 TaxID=1132836 RepID=UPI00027B817A|nr:ABC transporter permease [Rhizobium sp. CCGE 510]EJT04257.1 spermidine/putrescine transport system permease protein [Rhizobium sp. CCGE 510]
MTVTKKSEQWRGWFFVSPALLWTILFFAVPLCLMLVASLSGARTGGGAVGSFPNLGTYARFVGDPAMVRALVVSLEITVTVTVISILLAYPLAWIIAEKIPRRYQRLALVLSILPFWTSYVIRSYSWLLILGKNGVMNAALLNIGVISEPLEISATRSATVIGFVHFFIMLLTLTIYSNLIQLPPNYKRAAADLGAGGFDVFRLIILPLTIPGIMVGAFLTFVLCIGDYITPQILGGNRELVLPQVIMMQLGRRSDIAMASSLSMVLMALMTLAYLGFARWLKLERT